MYKIHTDNFPLNTKVLNKSLAKYRSWDGSLTINMFLFSHNEHMLLTTFRRCDNIYQRRQFENSKVFTPEEEKEKRR